MTCEFTHLDGAYLLGALAPRERQEFERHLGGCAECSRAVAELAGLPGLLARVAPEDLGTTPDVPVPDSLLPGLVRAARRSQRRRSIAIAVLSAAAVTVTAISLLATGVIGGGDAPAVPAVTSSSTAAGRAMTTMGYSSVRGSLDVVGVAWGTRLDLTCTYQPVTGDAASSLPGTYVMVVHTRSGRTQQVATWKPLPGRTMRLSAATAAVEGELAWVEVRTPTGEPVLRLTL